MMKFQACEYVVSVFSRTQGLWVPLDLLLPLTPAVWFWTSHFVSLGLSFLLQ